MARCREFASMLLITSALIAPCHAYAQSAPTSQPVTPPSAPAGEASAPQAQSPASDAQPQTPAEGAQPAADQAAAEAAPDVSIPGAGVGDIVVVGRHNIVRSAPQVVSILSSADIARTGEGNIAGSLARVTGLSVVGNGFVYVRGLGDRYSLALLNGLPLPSPEPLRRTVPLDLFPTGVIASSLVQKTYSVNFPGEFGGGVINLTTKSTPEHSFLSIGGAIAGNSETTGHLGYDYFGSSSDWTGFDNGTRNYPKALASYLASGNRISAGNVNTQAIASQLVSARNSLVQRIQVQPNTSASLSGGTKFELGDVTLGVIAAFGYSNTWRTRDTLQQTASTRDLSEKELDFRRVITDDRIVVNALTGYGLEWGDNKIRWTTLYVRDTLKQSRIGVGTRQTTSPTATLQQQDTAWYERQLLDTQLVGEFRLTPELRLDTRGAFADSRREAPNEFSYEYLRSNAATDPYGAYFVNRLNNGQRGSASVSYSQLKERLWSGGADLSYKLSPALTGTIGYAYTDTDRRTERRDFQFVAPNTFPTGVGLFRPDLLLQPSVINFYGIGLIDSNEANPVFRATLRNHAGYGQIQAQIAPAISLNAGVRYETAKQVVSPVQVFNVPTASLTGTQLDRSYLLPAATLTVDVADDMKLRFNASKTIARPQFRELIYQLYFDPDSNRSFRGNPLLTDSQLINAEIRYEWYFATDQRFSLAGFYKRIDHPIEAFASFSDNTVVTSFANAPRARLYGAEFEAQKYLPLGSVIGGDFGADHRAVLIGNYTYTKSNIRVRANDRVAVFASASTAATDYFRDGGSLTGQSDHLVNVQLGLEDTTRLSQQTLLLTYASDRVTSRGASGQPDIVERPGIRVDFVAREGITVLGRDVEIKFDVRNLTNTQYQEFQQSGANKVYYNKYRIGASASLGVSLTF